ncbi:YALIA101S02e19944g1_1 [Yarrowia lipolytica]|nr:YALIA101S02e19944g1_1 [Yarrowia lipolytica]
MAAPIAPIVGSLKRRIFFDITTALGFSAGALWWFGYHKPTVAAKDAWYAAREQEKNNQ